MDTPPVGNNPKVRPIRATYYPHAHRPTVEAPDSARESFAVAAVAILVLIVIAALASILKPQ